ncbi:hypothetical protein [Neisseria musculi]|uniref:Uncharacterized protein n=1 Tax=Neisseria musculi TaxID=1815583 RepID=A0A7H1MDK9_9NEIS|nr:hypothetical protein [Neisseria musculi]QNT59724.1 hypothetical protein H7A79_1007 [Neisseria musculi]
MKEYTFSYRFGGKWWSINISADHPDQAKAKLRAAAGAVYDGEVAARLHIPVKASWLARLAESLKQWRK